MIANIIIDIGGLLFDVDGSGFMLNEIYPKIDLNTLWKEWQQCSTVIEFEEGRINYEEFAEGIISYFGLRMTKQKFMYEFTKWASSPYPESRYLLKTLKKRNYYLATLCNTNEVHWKIINETDNFLEYFNCKIASHEIGVVKPKAKSFEILLDKCNLKNDVYYFDDQIRNVEAAIQCRIKAYHVTSTKELKMALQNLGIL